MHLAGDVGGEEHEVRPLLAQDGGQRILDLRRRLEERVRVIARAQPVEIAHAVEAQAIGLRADDDHPGRREIHPARDLALELAAVARAGREIGRSRFEREQRPDPQREPGAPAARGERAGGAAGERASGGERDRRQHRQQVQRQLRAGEGKDRHRHEDARADEDRRGVADQAGGEGAAPRRARPPHDGGEGERTPWQRPHHERRQVDHQRTEQPRVALVAGGEEASGDLVVEQVAAGPGDAAENRQVPEGSERQGHRGGERHAPEERRRPQPSIDDHESEQRGQLDEHRRTLGEQAEAGGAAGEEPGQMPTAGGLCPRAPHDAEPGPGGEAGERKVGSRRVRGDERQQRGAPGEGREGASLAIPEGASQASDGHGGEQEVEGETEPGPPLVLSQEGHPAGHRPEQERRFVEEVQAAEVGHQPVSGGEHGRRDAAVAPFVGFPEAARALEGDREKQQDEDDRAYRAAGSLLGCAHGPGQRSFAAA